jgi:F-type H+-transporting ATPase subunit a
MENTLKLIQNPLDQFEIRDLIIIHTPILGNFSLSLANITLYLIISAIIIVGITAITNKSKKVIFNKWTLTNESIYDTIHSIVVSQINNTSGQMYFPFIYTLFLFILINNLMGLVPYSFATTSHIVLTFALSFSIVLGATILGLKKHNIKFFALFVPAGCPLALVPLLVIIEFLSYIARNVSLGLRLAANILSGHMLLNILSGFTYNAMTSGIVFFVIGLLPLSFIVVFCGLELAIAFIQAQVFVVLTCSYTKDAIYLH